jgi:hypothetical protein
MVATKVRVSLKSLSPVCFDRYSGLNDQNDQEAQKNAIQKVYRNETGEVCIPAACIKASTREASTMIGNVKGGKQRRNAVRAALFIFPDMIPVAKDVDGIHPEIVTRGKGDKVTRVVSYRPFLKTWECTFDALLYDLTPENVRQYMQLAGVRYGICGHRPEWGRFEVAAFEVIEKGD